MARTTYRCGFCDRIFKRSEHLKRHERGHTGEAGFGCTEPGCGKMFSRSDVLRRHARIHGETSAAPSTAQEDLNTQVEQTTYMPAVGAAEPAAAGSRKRGRSPEREKDAGGQDAGVEDADNALASSSRTLLDGDPAAAMGDDLSHLDDLFRVLQSPPALLERPRAQDGMGFLGGLPEYSFPSDLFFRPSPTYDAVSQSQDLYTQDAFSSSWLSDFAAPQVQISDTAQLSNIDLATALGMPSFSVPFDDWAAAYLTTPAEASADVDAVALAFQAGPTNIRASPGIGSKRRNSQSTNRRRGKSGRDASWPAPWIPAQHDSSLSLDGFEAASQESLSIPISALVPHFDEPARLSVLETLMFCDGLTLPHPKLPLKDYHSNYQQLSRLPLATFDNFLQHYFASYHPRHPFIHIPSFKPSTTNGFLLMSILAIGALYSRVPRASELAEVLFEISRRGSSNLMRADNRLARNLPMVQALMLWNEIRWIGSARLLEISQIHRSAYSTALRYLSAFEARKVPAPSEGSLRQRWNVWILEEETRRTALTAFSIESELSSLLGLPPELVVRELKTSLACEEVLWEAASPEAWQALMLAAAPFVSFPAAMRLLRQKGKSALPPVLVSHSFNTAIVFKILANAASDVPELQSAGFDAGKDSLSLEIKISLSHLSGGSHEFTSMHAVQDEPRFASSMTSYHLTQIALLVPIGDLLDMSGRRSQAETAKVQQRIEALMAHDEAGARALALHAGQITRVIRAYPSHSPHEPVSLFFAALVLYTFSRVASSEASLSAEPPADAEEVSCCLDARQDVLPWEFLNHGGRSQLDSILDLRQPSAPSQVLALMASFLTQTGRVWRIGESLARALDALGPT